MPKEDWKKNTIYNIFNEKGLYPKGKIVSVLDVACGLSLKSQYLDCDIRVGIDVYKPYLEKIESKVPFIPVCENVKNISNLFLENSFDIVMALDVVEHLTKEDALKLIKDCEKIAKKACIIETPEGFIPQDIDIWGHGGDEYQTHRSGWDSQEFLDLGYEVITRSYTMQDIKRHSELDVDTKITLIDAIKLF